MSEEYNHNDEIVKCHLESLEKKDKELFTGETKTVVVRLAAYTRCDYSATVEVPKEMTRNQLMELGYDFKDKVDGGDYTDDADYWDEEQPEIEEVKDGEA